MTQETNTKGMPTDEDMVKLKYPCADINTGFMTAVFNGRKMLSTFHMNPLDAWADARVNLAAPPEPPKTPEPPLREEGQAGKLEDYWRCFHCDFATRDAAEAEAHFGERDDAEEFKPICKWWASLDAGEKIDTLQTALQDLSYERMENYNLDKKIGPLLSEINRLKASLRTFVKIIEELYPTDQHSEESRAVFAAKRDADLLLAGEGQ